MEGCSASAETSAARLCARIKSGGPDGSAALKQLAGAAEQLTAPEWVVVRGDASQIVRLLDEANGGETRLAAATVALGLARGDPASIDAVGAFLHARATVGGGLWLGAMAGALGACVPPSKMPVLEGLVLA